MGSAPSFLDWFEEPYSEHLEAELKVYLSLAAYVEQRLPATDSLEEEALFDADHDLWVLYQRAREAAKLMRTFVAAIREAAGQHARLDALAGGLSETFLVLDELRGRWHVN